MTLKQKMDNDLITSICKEYRHHIYSENRRFILIQNSMEIPVNEERVAIFPTDYQDCPLENTPTIFFVDRFRKRFKNFSQQYITKFLSKTIFSDLMMVKDKELDCIISLWIETHERMHEGGKLPLSKYLLEKSYRFSAAFEELRVDINSAKLLISNKNSTKYNAGLVILAERMIGYPLFRKFNDSDTISSVLLGKIIEFNFRELISSKDVALKSLKKIASELDEIEDNINATLRDSPRNLDNYIKSIFQNNYLSYYNEYKNYWRNYENCNR